jgi:hypothetical protein
MNYHDLSDFTRAYVDAMLWTECNSDNEELDGKGYNDLAPETITKIIEDCAGFEMLNKPLLDKAGDTSQNGHDFWLTRNHHGAGFWDRGYTDNIGDDLTTASQKYKSLNLVLGDDQKLYLEG